MAGEIYFDNNATTRVLPELAEAMLPFLTEYYGNPSSIHRFGSEVGQKVGQARAQVTALIGAADPIEVIFTRPRYVFCPCPAEMPFEMIVLLVFLPIWIIFVPVSACW